MGFGTLFFGYFLLLNVVQYGLTDIIASLVMLLALLKLEKINRFYKYSLYIDIAFSVLALGELCVFGYQLFIPNSIPVSVISYISIFRSAILCVFNVVLLRGCYDLAREVGLEKLSIKSKRLPIFVIAVYILSILMETSAFFAPMSNKVFMYISTFVILATLIVICFNLSVIFSCYSKICMPEDNKRNRKK